MKQTIYDLQVIQEVLCWSRNPMEVRRLCARKEEIYAKLIGNHKPPVVPGVPMFLETLVKHNVSACLPSQALSYAPWPAGMLDYVEILPHTPAAVHDRYLGSAEMPDDLPLDR